MDKKFKNLTWHYDASHAWLQVSIKQLETLQIKEKISPFSFYTHNKENKYCGYAFLEEDCDASIYINAVGFNDYMNADGEGLKSVDHGVKADGIRFLKNFPSNAESSRISVFKFFDNN